MPRRLSCGATSVRARRRERCRAAAVAPAGGGGRPRAFAAFGEAVRCRDRRAAQRCFSRAGDPLPPRRKRRNRRAARSSRPAPLRAASEVSVAAFAAPAAQSGVEAAMAPRAVSAMFTGFAPQTAVNDVQRTNGRARDLSASLIFLFGQSDNNYNITYYYAFYYK